MSGSTLTACDGWATLNVFKLQKSCLLRDFNLRPLEQNWNALTLAAQPLAPDAAGRPSTLPPVVQPLDLVTGGWRQASEGGGDSSWCCHMRLEASLGMWRRFKLVVPRAIDRRPGGSALRRWRSGGWHGGEQRLALEEEGLVIRTPVRWRFCSARTSGFVSLVFFWSACRVFRCFKTTNFLCSVVHMCGFGFS
jgi:hypothetical protein